ncbi:hypothetical protein [Neisseria sp. 83E34]|uniref:hypothetical protein n=1 Tax=Neisseria sp. 83E34 TaxID=1692264 RepID=UPI0006CE770D|nr:hypothetical protein [Neisseria sp. 83E34]
MASTAHSKTTAIVFSWLAVAGSFTSLADKTANNQGIKVSDVMATQAALGSLLGNAAQYAGDAIGSRNKAAGKALETVGNANSKLASAYAASALALNKTKADLAVWDPHDRTGLPKITDLDASTETLKKTGDILKDNVKSEFEKSFNDVKDIVRDIDKGGKDLLDKGGEAILPTLLDISKTLDKALDPNTWKEKAREFFEEIDKGWAELREAMEQKLLPKILDWASDWGTKEKHWCTPEDWKEWQDANRSGKFHVLRPDPLTLDLDGDGIETVSTNAYKGALFDHDKDGIQTATGWVAADDGFLVIDRNEDGIINNGNELFGDNYTLKDGSNAPTGFAALAEFDSNGDGVVDAKDENFAKLRVWRDLNQDGASQKDELFALQDVNVQSLNVAHQNANKNLGNGNRLAR